MEEWRLAEVIAQMLDVSALLPMGTKIETLSFRDYLYVTVEGKRYKITVEEVKQEGEF